MNTIKIYLAESGRIADLKKDFPLYQYQFQNKLLNIFVPTSILAPDFQSQSATGEVLTDYVAGTSVKIGMSYTARDGSIKVSKNYYMRYLKTLTYQNVEYALYERKLPKEFTNYAGQGANAPILTINIVNIQEKSEDGTPIVLSVTATQTCSLDVMKSTSLDNDEAVEPTELENINAEINSINAILPTKQDKVDENLTTTNKSVVGAINENKSRIDVNTINIQTNTQNISRNRSDIDLLIARMKLSEDYIGQLTGEELPTNSELNAFVKANTLPSRDPRNGDVIIFIQQIEGATDKNYKYFYSQMDWQHYEIPPIESASNGTLGLVRGTYIIGKPVDHVNTTLVDIIDGEIVNIYVADKTGTLRNIVEYLNSNSAVSKELETQLNAIADTVAKLETADTQNVKLTGDQVIQGIKNFVGTLQVNGENITNVIGDLVISQQIELGADGIIGSNNITYTVQNAEDYLPYRTNLRKFILNLHLPVSGEVDSTFPVNITFGDTTYYVYNIINNSRITWADLLSNTTQTAEGFTTIIEATMLITESLVGFYIILPTYASATTDMEKIVNNTTLIVNSKNGFAGGSLAQANSGGAIGRFANADYGGAVGQSATASSGGAVGENATTSIGGAIGWNAKSDYGGAIGASAKTSNGFAGGYIAQTIDTSGNGIDAIQLGTGTNSTAKTLQVYDYTLMNADGTIPAERLTNETTARETADSELQTAIDNIVNNTTLIANSKNGFAGGSLAQANSGGAIGQNSKALTGGAVGNGANSTVGGAIGQQAKTGNGFAGGYLAQTVNSSGIGIDAIQLGKGTNNTEKTLQVYDDNIYNSNTHTLTVTGAITDGTNSITIGEIVNNIGGVSAVLGNTEDLGV